MRCPTEHTTILGTEQEKITSVSSASSSNIAPASDYPKTYLFLYTLLSPSNNQKRFIIIIIDSEIMHNYKRSKYYAEATLNPQDIVEPIGYKFLNQEEQKKPTKPKKFG